MPKLIALLQFLLALSGCSLGGMVYNDRIAEHGHEILASKAQAQDGSARFECRASASGWCHYTLYPDTCHDKACERVPLRHFAVARGDSRQFAGLGTFRLCVATDAAPRGPDCQPQTADTAH